ncbi:hypothetical protein DPMN_174696 [Dreissena polymorpha]|uniref:Uncharacterized protein n=1 Tax=Dreissena polymorpha TaxID=45954 RepID=A0A9D4E3U8_DREPO|nr:hypothetical protein DPMN_174696 [Dreissena polymorpha]
MFCSPGHIQVRRVTLGYQLHKLWWRLTRQGHDGENLWPLQNVNTCRAPFGRTRCTLTSRRLPIGLNYVLRDILPGPFRTNKSYPPDETLCTLTSPRLPIWLNYVLRDILPGPFRTNKMHADQPSTAYRAELDRTYYATFCLASFGRTRCTLTSPYYATFCVAPFGRTRCTLISRRLPIGLNYFRPGLLIRIGCTLTSRRLPIGLKRPLSDKQELSPGSDLVHTELPLAACRADLISALCFGLR